jgi:hypothetical protein
MRNGPASTGSNPASRISAGRRATDDEPGVVCVHRQRAGDDDLSGQVARLAQRLVELIPMDGEQDGVGILRRLARRAGPREDRAELRAHQSRAQDADFHNSP